MRRTISFIGRMVCIGLLAIMTACSSDENGTQALTLQVKVLLPEGFTGNGNVGQKVALTKSGQEYTATTDEQGVATFEGVIPDIYDLTTSWEITPEQYMEMTGVEVQNENYTISGSLMKQTIVSSGTLQLQTIATVKQSLIISKIYYAGSKDLNNKNYGAGKYVEFYNNSDQAVNIAGLYFGLIESDASPAYMLGTTPDYLYLKQIFRFPTTGRTEIQPGETVLVANSAIDHTQAATQEKNLSEADFEVKQADNTNNPAIPAVDLIYTAFSNITSMNLVQSGPCSMVLFNTTENIADWERVYKEGASKGTLYVKIPIKYVMDGVECLKNTSTGVDTNKKRLYDYIDAGFINIQAITGYNGEVVYRKVEKTDNGRKILMDTNNSSNDFAVSDDINIREYK